MILGVNTSEADYPGECSFRRGADMYDVELGGDRYRLPDALIVGG